ncbi:septum site-determining protein MinD [Ihubacter sp. rT4E-8]|uniref:septum site-determining protein MinD n=1 Tax=unclassified Ihubacter TaxID=2633299 RepID=UPI00137A8050
MGKVYLIASGKGGTGKSMFAVNFGAALAGRGKSVVLLDMDLGLRNLDLYFGLENQVVYDVYDVLTGVCRIKQALIRDKRFENLYMMAAPPSRDDGSLTPLHLQVLCEKLKNIYDYVIIDAPSGIDDGLVLASAGADIAVLVTTPEYSALRDADTLDRELLQLGIKERFVVLNKVVAEMMNAGYAPRLREITAMLRPPLAGIIQYDENIQISTNLGVPIILKQGTYIEENFQRITGRIVDEA